MFGLGVDEYDSRHSSEVASLRSGTFEEEIFELRFIAITYLFEVWKERLFADNTKSWRRGSNSGRDSPITLRRECGIGLFHFGLGFDVFRTLIPGVTGTLRIKWCVPMYYHEVLQKMAEEENTNDGVRLDTGKKVVWDDTQHATQDDTVHKKSVNRKNVYRESNWWIEIDARPAFTQPAHLSAMSHSSGNPAVPTRVNKRSAAKSQDGTVCRDESLLIFLVYPFSRPSPFAEVKNVRVKYPCGTQSKDASHYPHHIELQLAQVRQIAASFTKMVHDTLNSSALAVVVAFLLFLHKSSNTGIAVGPHVVSTPEHICIGFLSDSKSWDKVRTACRRPAPASVLMGNSSAICVKEIEREMDRPFRYDNRGLISDDMWIRLPESFDERNCVLERKYLELILDIRGMMRHGHKDHKDQEEHWARVDPTLERYFGNSATMASSRANITTQDLRALFFTRLGAKCAVEQDLKYTVDAHVNASSIFVLDSIMTGSRVSLQTWYLEQAGNNGSNQTTEIKCYPVAGPFHSSRKSALISLELGDLVINVTDHFAKSWKPYNQTVIVCYNITKHLWQTMVSHPSYLPVATGTSSVPNLVDHPPPLNNLAPAELVHLECSCASRILASLRSYKEHMRPVLLRNAVLKRAQRLEALICVGNSNWVELFQDDHFEPVRWSRETAAPHE
ncbi:hypothetical protein M427DRAFT_146088 [Gonapodya prolifera JEL478]|uniref:Uncharacterized protein n=1 Tax=Gonapodya prolifera (strain JEL478) TaxID=1344416 RepID=A0A139AC28_GONPJ|nr:hypothetical protein M427DRAFT_146088 [Gonapodya prolifera JEL478]|eukprot:KXS14288.1 hypothetical protein M427DRAFT_146088 [Gonapodya prolifera JEL478]